MAIPELLKQFKDLGWPASAPTAASQLYQYGQPDLVRNSSISFSFTEPLRNELKVAIPDLILLLKDTRWDVRANTATSLQKFAGHC